MKKIWVFLFLLSALLLTVNSVYAGQYGCTGQYGSDCPPPLSILVDKTVGKPVGQTKGGQSNIEYVDNLSVSDYRFRPGQEIFFQIKVKNTSGQNLYNVTLRDYVPSYVEPIEGPGAFDSNTRIITINAGNFIPDEEKFYVVKMQIFPQDRLPADKGLFCLNNKAHASNGQTGGDDFSQFCLEKEVLGVPYVPKTGPEMGFLFFGAELTALGLGVILKRKASNKI